MDTQQMKSSFSKGAKRDGGFYLDPRKPARVTPKGTNDAFKNNGQGKNDQGYITNQGQIKPRA